MQLCSACIAVPDNADQQGNSYFLFQLNEESASPLGEKGMYTNILALNTGFLLCIFVSQFWEKLQTEILVLSNYVHTRTYTCTLPYIFTVKKERLFRLNLVTSVSSCIVKHSGVPLPVLDSKQIKNLIWLSRTLANVVGEYFANEIVQSCGKGYETEVNKMG